MLEFRGIITGRKGLILFELTIVLAIVAVLVSFAFPYFKTNKVVGAPREMGADMEYARRNEWRISLLYGQNNHSDG